MLTKTPPFYFIVCFWGKKYLDYFCNYSLASLLAPGNIPALDTIPENKFLICTTVEDWHALQENQNFIVLRRYLQPEFFELPSNQENSHKYTQMSRGHELLTSVCFRESARAIYIPVDTIFPDGSIAELERLALAGKKVVLATAIRFEMEGVVQVFKNLGKFKLDKRLVVSKRDAVSVGLANLHSESRAGEFNSPYFGELSPEHGRNHFPTCIYWIVPGEQGVIIYTHNWAPFLIDYSVIKSHDTEAFKGWAIDGDYIHRNFEWARIGHELHVVADSDSIFLLGLTPKAEMIASNIGSWWKTYWPIREWLKGYIVNQAVFDIYTDPLRREIYRIPVLWHANDLSDRWQDMENEANRIINDYGEKDFNITKIICGKVSIRDFTVKDHVRWLLYLIFFGATNPQLILNQHKVYLWVRRWWVTIIEIFPVIFGAIKGSPTQRERIVKKSRQLLYKVWGYRR